LRLLVAELSLWLQWRLIMIWHVWIWAGEFFSSSSGYVVGNGDYFKKMAPI
jgi:hypothetical protein